MTTSRASRKLEKSLSPLTETSFESENKHIDKIFIQQRMYSYISLVVLLILTTYILFSNTWVGNIDQFIFLEFSATIFAFIIGSMALIKFYTRNKSMYLLIGIGFLGAAFFDALQTIIPHFYSIQSYSYIHSELLHSWTMSRAFLAVFLLGSWIIWKSELVREMKIKKLYMLTLALAIVTYTFVLLYPRYMAISVVVSTISILTITVTAYLQKGYWKFKYFEHFLILALITAIFAEIFRLASVTPYDQLFFAAYFLKLISYLFVLLGLLMSMYKAFIEVEEERDKIDVILKSIGEGVFVTDREGMIVLMNKIAEKFSGFKFQHAKKKHYCDVFRFINENEKQEPFVDFVEKVIKSRKKKEVYPRLTLERNDNVRIPVSMNTAPIIDRGGKLFGCIVIFHDVTKERELEKVKDNFISVAAHQLRAPLGAMRWNMEMLISGDLGKISKNIKQNILLLHENNQRLITLVNDLLNVSRIDQKRVHDRPKPTNLVDLAQKVIKQLKHEAYIKSLTFKIIPEKIKIPEISIDPDRVYEVFENLISNAIKYNRLRGTIFIKISDLEDTIRFEIVDTGIGIPEKDQKYLFTKYYRATNARNSVADGSGLGLFVVKSYVEGWGGHISCKSIEGKGTTMFFSIPKKPKHHSLGSKLLAQENKENILKHK